MNLLSKIFKRKNISKTWEYKRNDEGVVWREDEGMSDGKIWLQKKENPEQTALFKPDTNCSDSGAEYTVAKIAKKLDLKCAETEIVKFKGQTGCLSHNFKTQKGIIYIPAATFRLPPEEPLTAALVRKHNPKYRHEHKDISMELIKSVMPEIEKDTVDMLFLDCLVQNRDRHGRNLEIMVDKDGRVKGLASLFDHGLSMNNTKSNNDFSKIHWNAQCDITHFELFKKLSENYPEQIDGLLQKANAIQDLDKFCLNRLEIMQDIYDKSKNGSTQQSTDATKSGSGISDNVNANQEKPLSYEKEQAILHNCLSNRPYNREASDEFKSTEAYRNAFTQPTKECDINNNYE